MALESEKPRFESQSCWFLIQGQDKGEENKAFTLGANLKGYQQTQ